MSDVKILFLGTGDFASNGCKANQAIWIQHEDTYLLLECGPTTLYRMQQTKLDPDRLSAVLVTHFHGDHFMGLIFLDLFLTLESKRTRKMVYAGPQGIAEHFQKAYQICYGDFYPNTQFVRDFTEYSPSQRYLLENISIQTIPMKHRQESLGYRLSFGNKTIAFTGDTGWHEGLIPLAQDADLLITECVEYERNPRQQHHLSYEDLFSNKEKLRAKHILLTHVGKSLLANKNKIHFEILQDGQEIIL